MTPLVTTPVAVLCATARRFSTQPTKLGPSATPAAAALWIKRKTVRLSRAFVRSTNRQYAGSSALMRCCGDQSEEASMGEISEIEGRWEENTCEHKSLMRTSYAVFCL